MPYTDKRPKYLNLWRIRLPMAGLTSIAHRIAGVLMFLALPLMTWLLHLSSLDPAGFERVRQILQAPFSRLLMLLLVWALMHHLLAGIRYLLLDLDIGIDKQAARNSAWLVFAGGFLLAAIISMGLM